MRTLRKAGRAFIQVIGPYVNTQGWAFGLNRHTTSGAAATPARVRLAMRMTIVGLLLLY